MATTNFVNGTVIEPSWLNDVDAAVYETLPAIPIDLADTSNTADGDALIGVKRTETGTVSTTLHDWIQDQVINVASDFGADPSGVADSTSAIQAAINTGAKAIFIPTGTYKVTAPITVSQSTAMPRIFGAGKGASILQASGTFNAVFEVGSVSAQSLRGTFQDLQINCNGAIVQYCIYGNRIEEFDFVGVAAWFARSANICTSSFSYVNTFDRCDIAYGYGDGIRFSADLSLGANNANTVCNSLILDNAGHGIRAVTGSGIRIYKNTIEQNDKSGILLGSLSGVSIKGNYFEQNGNSGIVFTSPSLTVKADIVLSGSATETSMSNAFPCAGAEIVGNNTAPGASMTSFVWDAGANDLFVGPNFCDSTNAIPCVGQHYDPQYKGTNLTITGCSTFTTPLTLTGASSAVNNTNAAYVRVKNPSQSSGLVRNLALSDMNQWSVLSGGSANTYRRSATSTRRKFNGCDVWEIASTASGTSDIYGFQIDAAAYPELNGKTMWHGVWVYITDSNCYAVPFNSVQSFNNNPTTINTWVMLAVSFTWPSSGTLSFGIYKTGSNTGSVFFSSPMLGLIGAAHDELIAANPPSRTWKGGAAPTAGTWDAGDRVERLPPAVGSPKAWACTVSGTPGTWVSEGNL